MGGSIKRVKPERSAADMSQPTTHRAAMAADLRERPTRIPDVPAFKGGWSGSSRAGSPGRLAAQASRSARPAEGPFARAAETFVFLFSSRPLET